ncbi:hypothetical protein BYT27DRAFT_7190912 [Phlegmacium glaucopus]|nr:hypothetical protein BYT27DRAFT_7199182 [Phlegmacium glaucopus]KAF8806722.1 hypothetical protein BYT27DRAFT_7190912 [Phlegmacium glaucopus]
MDPNSHTWLYFPVVDTSQRPPAPPILTQHPQGPIHQDMGLIRNQHRRHRVTEAPSPYQVVPESSRTITGDRSNGTHPSMGAIDNSGPGEARPPSRNPRMGNRGSIKQKRIEVFYNDDRSGPSQTETQESRGEEDPSTYEVPLVDLPIAGRQQGGLNNPTVIPAPAQSMVSTSAVPVSTPAPAEIVDEDATTPAPISTPGTAGVRQRGRSGNILKTKV